MTKRPKNTAGRSLAKFSLLALLAAGIYLYSLTRPAGQSTTPLSFEVQKGESVKSIATHLHEAGLLRSPLYFRLLVRQNRLSLQAGSYGLSPSLTPKQLSLRLTKGLAVDKKITIPEGFRAEQIAEVAGLGVKEFLLAASGLEGQLFPDTYFVKEGTTALELVTILHNNYLKKVGELDKETLILSSLVERETSGDAEKPLVAGILKKRLSAGWPLELDATIQYALGKPGDWWPDTTLLDRTRKSPYNTYLHLGLPPAPISNPGLAAINAVKNAAESPYWFYLHDKNGLIHYAKTNAEHSDNIAKFILDVPL